MNIATSLESLCARPDCLGRSTSTTLHIYMLVEDVMSRALVTIDPEETLRAAFDLLLKNRIRHLPVVDGSGLVGIVTDRDVKRATPSVLSGIDRGEYDHVLETTKVAQFMTRDPVTVTPKTGLKAAVEIFLKRRVGALPVVDDGRLVGILSDTDIMHVAFDLLPD
jgi:acetoin utilization protein AcuB